MPMNSSYLDCEKTRRASSSTTSGFSTVPKACGYQYMGLEVFSFEFYKSCALFLMAHSADKHPMKRIKRMG
jgi:hypothetical protein